MIGMCSCGATWMSFELVLNNLGTTKLMLTHWASGHKVEVLKPFKLMVEEMAGKLQAIGYVPKGM